jgi:hypothetical protein
VPDVVERRENDAENVTQEDARRREVSASAPTSTDEAVRLAAKLAIDAGDLGRARALLDLLEAKPRSAGVTPLVIVQGDAGPARPGARGKRR